jgi:hypothetical protein
MVTVCTTLLSKLEVTLKVCCGLTRLETDGNPVTELLSKKDHACTAVPE